jgi:GTPase
VWVRATTDMLDLSPYARSARWSAEPGGDGAGGRKSGRRGADLTLDVPVGTVVIDEEGGLIADLDHPGARHEVVRGGAGGRGNVHFKSPTRQAPDHAEPGVKGEELTVVLDLKLIADVGLVGPPNAGKSSLLRALTAAKPKVAEYPFTTLNPELGVMEVGGHGIVLAEIPGLVEGAAQGAGLGLRFLRHVERTRLLVYVIDCAAANPWQDLETVRAEVAAFSAAVATRPYIVAVNKIDLPEARRSRTRRKRTYYVSAAAGEGIAELADGIADALAHAPKLPLPTRRAAPKKLPELAPALAVQRHPWGYRVSGDRVERLVERTDLESDSALERFQVELDRLGVNVALEAAGVKAGDTVQIGPNEFEYQP